jgi:acetyl-CoA C-acetyltransferase
MLRAIFVCNFFSHSKVQASYRKNITRHYATNVQARDVVIVSALRTAVGSFNGTLASFPAPKLASFAIKAAIEKAAIKPEDVEEVYMGNVLQANVGQSPARQAALYAGLPVSTDCTTVNKVCASGMKAIMLGAQSIMLGHRDVVVAGGMESMSQVPFYLDAKARLGLKYGHFQMVDGILRDGLTDVYDGIHMGNCGDMCATKYNISREEQDKYAIESYKRATAATKEGKFKEEIVPISVPQKKGDAIVFVEDEEFQKVNYDKIPTLKPVFDPKGTVTAANASALNDGAAAVVLMSAERAKAAGLKPLARIRGFADAATFPKEFTVAPALAIPRALSSARLKQTDIDLWEINEAFAVVVLANMKLLGLDHSKVNVRGGAIALGHAIGSSGARITVTLIHALSKNKLGCAAICNGGGGASALILERL